MPARRSHAVVAALTAIVALVLAACDPHTVSIGFDPPVGDRYRFRSEVATTVTRTIDGETSVDGDDAVLDATEEVVGHDGDEVVLSVTLRRDGADPRTYEVRVDRGDRLTAIDLIEGIPAERFDLGFATELPTEVATPPPGPLEPGTTWSVEHASDGDRAITGTGTVTSLGVVDGRDAAHVEVDLEVPVATTIDTTDGRVSLTGTQSTRSRTTYDLGDGAVRRDRTAIVGEADVAVAPPAGVDADPVRGTLRYEVRIDTTRVPLDAAR